MAGGGSTMRAPALGTIELTIWTTPWGAAGGAGAAGAARLVTAAGPGAGRPGAAAKPNAAATSAANAGGFTICCWAATADGGSGLTWGRGGGGGGTSSNWSSRTGAGSDDAAVRAAYCGGTEPSSAITMRKGEEAAPTNLGAGSAVGAWKLMMRPALSCAHTST